MKREQVITLIKAATEKLSENLSELDDLDYELKQSDDDVELCERQKLEKRTIEAEAETTKIKERLEEVTQTRDKFIFACKDLRASCEKMSKDLADAKAASANLDKCNAKLYDIIIKNNINPVTGDKLPEL